MSATLKQKAEHAALRRQIATDKVAAKQQQRVLAYLNDNLKQTRKRRLGATMPADASRDFSNQDRAKSIAMSRQKVEELPLVAGMLQSHLDLVVGTGYRLIMKTGVKKWDDAVEESWYHEKDLLDIRGMRSWMRLLRATQARQKVDCDVGGVLVAGEFDGKPWSRVQLIEADRIVKDPKAAGGVDDGIDFDNYGMPTKYYVWNRDNDKPVVRGYDPQEFFFYQNDFSERVERKRGVSALLPLHNLIADHGDIIDGIVQKVKKESFFGLKLKMSQGGDGKLFGEGQESRADEAGVTRQHIDMVTGMNLHLNPDENEEAEFMESKSPGAEFSPFEKMVISRISYPFGLTYELVTGDFSGLSWHSARTMVIMVMKRVRIEQGELGRVASRIFNWWLSREVKAKRLTPPAGMNKYWTHDWGKPGFPSLNPSQEAQAYGALLDRGLITRQRILAETGDDDFDDTIEQLEREQDAIEASGVPIVSGNGNFVQQNGDPASQAPVSVEP